MTTDTKPFAVRNRMDQIRRNYQNAMADLVADIRDRHQDAVKNDTVWRYRGQLAHVPKEGLLQWLSIRAAGWRLRAGAAAWRGAGFSKKTKAELVELIIET